MRGFLLITHTYSYKKNNRFEKNFAGKIREDDSGLVEAAKDAGKPNLQLLVIILFCEHGKQF